MYKTRSASRIQTCYQAFDLGKLTQPCSTLKLAYCKRVIKCLDSCGIGTN